MLTECRELLQFMLSVFVSGLLNQPASLQYLSPVFMTLLRDVG
jgi:hypothetical protein